MQENILVKASDEVVDLLSQYLNERQFNHLCSFEKNKSLNKSLIIEKDGHETKIEFPFRLGFFIDLLHKKRTLSERIITFEKGRLDIAHNTFIKENDQKVSLTEKEVEVLIYLNSKQGARASRSDLLNAVWQYAQDVQTHTIETHIYRLRQKIEDDPSNPEILMTDSEGYYIS